MIDIRPTLTIMIGIPFSGKSTLTKWLAGHAYPEHVKVLSTDDTLYKMAEERGTDYRGVYVEYISAAQALFHADLNWYATRTPHIIVDRTNVTKDARAGLVNMVKAVSPKRKIVFVEIEPRLDESLHRHDKSGRVKLSDDVIIGKYREFERVTADESFDEHYIFDINGLAVDMKTKNRI